MDGYGTLLLFQFKHQILICIKINTTLCFDCNDRILGAFFGENLMMWPTTIHVIYASRRATLSTYTPHQRIFSLFSLDALDQILHLCISQATTPIESEKARSLLFFAFWSSPPHQEQFFKRPMSLCSETKEQSPAKVGEKLGGRIMEVD